MTKYYDCHTFLLASELWKHYYRGMQRDLSKTFFEKLPSYVTDGLVATSHHSGGKLSIYNYTPKVQFERLWDDITRACRGLILDDAGNIVARPFQKFFNLDEHQPEEIPNEPFKVYEKMDGSLGILYWLNNEPAVATRGSFVSGQAIHATSVLKTKYSHLLPGLDKNLTYLFEIIYPENRIVVNYGTTDDLILLATIVTGTGEEIELSERWGFPIVKRYDGISDISTIREIQKDNAEGFVLRFTSGFRVKVKFNEYVRLHRILTHASPKAIWSYLSAGLALDNFLEQVPDEFYQWVKVQQTQLQMQYTEIESLCKSQFVDLGNRRLNAEHYNKNCKYPGILFKMLDQRDYSQLIWKLIKPSGEKSFKREFDV
mgnify:CR=1 FL=1